MNKQNDEIEIDIVQVLKALWHKVWLIILLAVVCAAIAFSIASFLITPTYQSSALLYVNSSTVNVGEMKMTVSDLSVSSNLVDYYIIILNTRSTLEDVIKEANLSYTFEQLGKMISASAVNKTGIFEITVTSTSPSEAEKIARTITYILPSKIEDIMEGTSARVVDFAVIPSQKSAPNITRYTILGFMLGAFIAAVIIITSELMDDIIHSGEYIAEVTNVPILAEIPDLLDEKTSRKYGKYGKYGKYENKTGTPNYAQYSSVPTVRKRDK